MIYARIAGTGSYLPEQIFTNHDMEKRIDTSDAWIVERTGIRERLADRAFRRAAGHVPRRHDDARRGRGGSCYSR